MPRLVPQLLVRCFEWAAVVLVIDAAVVLVIDAAVVLAIDAAVVLAIDAAVVLAIDAALNGLPSCLPLTLLRN